MSHLKYMDQHIMAKGNPEDLLLYHTEHHKNKLTVQMLRSGLFEKKQYNLDFCTA